MADSKRLRALKALQAFLANEITIVNGYEFDLSVSGAVIRGRRHIGKGDPLPCVSILEDLDPDRFPQNAGELARRSKFNLNLLIQGWAEDDKSSPTDPCYNLMADVGKALWKLNDQDSPHYLLPVTEEGVKYHLVEEVRAEAGTVRPPDQASELAFFWRKISLVMTESTAEPYRLDV